MVSGELIRRSTSISASHRRAKYGRASDLIHAETGLQLTVTRAMSTAGRGGMFEVLDIENTRKELELMNPVAAEALGLIAKTVEMEITQSIRRFCFELGG
jgi:hypothetical protein